MSAFPRDCVVLIGDTAKTIGVVAPALQSGHYLVGSITDTKPFRFVSGPSIVNADSVWPRLAKLNPDWIAGSCFLEMWLRLDGGQTPDGLIDRVTAPVLPSFPTADDSHKADWWKEEDQ